MLVTALVVTLGVLFAGSVSGSLPRSIHVVRAGPALVVTGRAFVPGERIRLTAFVGDMRTAVVRVRRDGSFTVRLLGVRRGCLVWRALVVGSRSGRAAFRSPTVDCRPEPTWPAPRSGTGIAGNVRRGPIRPVCTVELPCDGPAPGVAVVVSQGATAVARTATDAQGHFVVQVPAGLYTVTALALHVTPVELRVRDGSFARVTFSVDTGIR